MSRKYFGTDGIRGRANGVITAELALKVGQAVGLTFQNGDDHIGTALEWGVRVLDKPVVVHAEGDRPEPAKADIFPAYDEDGGLLLVLTPKS